MKGDRLVDRTGKDWDEESQTTGLSNRIKVASPEKRITLRPKTEEVTADPARGVRWNNLIELMIDKRILARTDEPRTFIKQTEGLGNEETKDIHELIESTIQNEMSTLDTRNEAERKRFIELWVREQLTRIHGEIEPKTYNKILAMLPAIAEELNIEMLNTTAVQIEIAQKAVNLLSSVNASEVSKVEYDKLSDFFINLREVINVIFEQQNSQKES